MRMLVSILVAVAVVALFTLIGRTVLWVGATHGMWWAVGTFIVVDGVLGGLLYWAAERERAKEETKAGQ